MNLTVTDDGNGKLIDYIDNYEIWSVNSAVAAKQLGRFYKGVSAKWCISTDNCDYYWNNDHKNDTFYFLIKKQPAFDQFDKLAFEFKANGIVQIWDINNRKNTFKNEKIISYMKTHYAWIDRLTDAERYFHSPGLKIERNEDNTVNLYGDIYLDGLNLTEVPWKNKYHIHILTGNLYLNDNKLTELTDMPHIINGDLELANNKLSFLAGISQKINGNLNIMDNELTEIDYMPEVTGYVLK